MICNEERHTERLTPKITTYKLFYVCCRYSKAKPAGYRKCPDYKKMDTFLLYKEKHKTR